MVLTLLQFTPRQYQDTRIKPVVFYFYFRPNKNWNYENETLCLQKEKVRQDFCVYDKVRNESFKKEKKKDSVIRFMIETQYYSLIFLQRVLLFFTFFFIFTLP